MSSAGGRPSWQTTVSVGTSIVPPGPCPPPEDTPGSSSATATPQATASIHDFAVSLDRARADAREVSAPGHRRYPFTAARSPRLDLPPACG